MAPKQFKLNKDDREQRRLVAKLLLAYVIKPGRASFQAVATAINQNSDIGLITRDEMEGENWQSILEKIEDRVQTRSATQGKDTAGASK
uniref:GRIP domain-containing protein n=1 Tax=Steinernema glaseri TaxID=37863 RepID=A0A1I8A703_9BILA